MKKIKSMEYVLSLGAFILLFSGIALIFNDSFSSMIVKVSGMALLTIFLMVLSVISEKVLKVENASRISFYLSFISLVISYVLMGCNSMFGKWFSIDGDGVQIFLASIAILVAILSVITAIKYKNFSFIHITFVCVLVTMFHLFTFFNLDFQITLIIIGSILLIFNLFKVNKIMYEFTSVAIYVFAMICMLFGYSDSFLLSSILLVINSVAIINALFKYKDLENELLSVIILAISIIVFIESSFDIFDNGVVIVVASFIICLLDLAINCFKLLNKKYVKIIFKAFISIVLLYLIGSVMDKYFLPLLVLALFMIVSSFVNTFVIKNHDFEEYLFPFKIVITLMITYNFIDSIVSINYIYYYVITSFVVLVLYKLSKTNHYKVEYMILNILNLFLMTSGASNLSVVEYIIVSLTLFISYLAIGYKRKESEYNVYYTVILLFLLSVSGNLEYGSIKLLVLSLILGISLYINFKNKYNFTITTPVLLYVLNIYVKGIITNVEIHSIIMCSFYFILVSIIGEVLFNKSKDKDIFISLLSIFGLLYLLDFDKGFITCIYSLVVSLIMIFISLKNKDFKVLYYVGLVFSILNILQLLRFLDGLPVAIYLLIIGMILIIVVSIMIYKYQIKEKERKDEPILVKTDTSQVSYKANFCGVCGNKLSDDENFCGNCGKKLK